MSMNWIPGQLTVTGPGAPPNDEILSASFTYGALGTCQQGEVKLAHPVHVAPRTVMWQFHLDGQPVFAGIVDSSGDSVTFLAPHRRMMNALGVSAPGVPTTYGVTYTPPAAHEKKIDAINRALDPYPTADYGVTPGLAEVIGVPEAMGFAAYTLDDRLLDLQSQGVGVPNYVTDAVFDPGDGWRKYTYTRPVPDFYPRETASVQVEPAIITSLRPVPFTFHAPINFFGEMPQPQFDGQPHDIRFAGGLYRMQIPANTDISKNRKLTVTFPYRVDSIPADHRAVIVIQMREVGGVGYTEVRSDIPSTNLALEKGLTIDFPPELLERAALMEFLLVAGYEVDNVPTPPPTGSWVFHPVRCTLEFEEPNLPGVKMPEGWDAPFAVGPVYEYRIPGWHVPPLLTHGLPAGSQYAAGTTITWNKDEATTRVTTMAWPYTGQRRSG